MLERVAPAVAIVANDAMHTLVTPLEAQPTIGSAPLFQQPPIDGHVCVVRLRGNAQRRNVASDGTILREAMYHAEAARAAPRVRLVRLVPRSASPVMLAQHVSVAKLNTTAMENIWPSDAERGQSFPGNVASQWRTSPRRHRHHRGMEGLRQCHRH